MADRESLIMQLYKNAFGKNFNKYDISVRYDAKDGSLHMNEHRDGEENFTKEQIDGAETFFQQSIESLKQSGNDVSRKKAYEISLAAIRLMKKPPEEKK